ncbi:glutamyl-tRNA amidotransferase [Halothiobacillus diazotrophicus]|uniref:Glutamyl-tRNA amidotransferase n=1 Tax=Halothiobacillus diazotrophicus TaxID=1860122 RepID=A0A191ZGV6_9GAMM|nr:GatB/YqeY domain-containing protein [Halothiobacillus diazotrophicus]ANJ67119.1 glutamyl-tRNA amidotransferase [Halothiobacillus diazotrophicus]
MSALKARLTDDMKTAMKSGDKSRLGVIRLLLAAIKQKEVDERVTLSDDDVLAVLIKQAKQRRESIAQYETAGRDDLVATEQFELGVIESYLPTKLDDTEVRQIIADVIAETGAQGASQMGAVMNAVRAKVAGRADMAQVSQWVKSALTG